MVNDMFEEVERLKRERVRDAETACNNSPLDPETWRHWAVTLLQLSGVMTDKLWGAVEIRDAITKLNKCLELQPKDPLEVKWKIGESLVHLLSVDNTMPNDVYKQCCEEALQCFNEVRAVEPEYKKGFREPEIAQESLKYMNSLSAPKFAEVAKLKESEVAKQACKDNSDDAENWNKWVMSLVRLRGIMDEKDLDKDMLTVAKKKLKEALKEDNKNLGFKWCLGEVYILLVSADPSICESRYLYRKHCDKAIDCFDAVRSMDNNYGRGSTGPYTARNGLEYVKHCC